MAKVVIDGTEFMEVSRRITKRHPTIDDDFLPISKGFKAAINSVPSQLVLITVGGVVLVEDDATRHFSWDSIQEWDGHTLAADNMSARLDFDFQGSADRFGHVLTEHVPEDVPITHTDIHPDEAYQRTVRALPLDRVTTLQELPGHQTVHSLGLVGSLQAASGFTAGGKGRTAMDNVLRDLGFQAHSLGANAITGLNSNAFGAGGGITGVLGGDAVGVLLIGTAVQVVPLEDQSEDL